MAKYLYVVCACCLLCLFGGCAGKEKGEGSEPPLHPYVEAFTSGTISRYTPVYLIFNREIAADRRKPDRLGEWVKIQPETAGSFAFENSRTIVFKPAKSFERGTRYEIKADLSEWFDTEQKDQYFTFHFSTPPLLLRAGLQSLDINRKNENSYDIVCSVFTPDRETPETIEPLVRFSEKADATWQHSPDGKRHEIYLSNIQAGKEERTLRLSVAPNKRKVPEEELLSVAIPKQDDFDLYDIDYVAEPERYVEVTFTKLLDEAQNMQGLARIEGNKSEAVSVEGNKLRLYPDAGSTGEMDIHLSREIRSKNGQNLREEVVRQITAGEKKPEVRFIGNGVIIPQSAQLTVPFRAVSLRGVVVRVIKIYEQNIGQFLQENDLEGSDGLMRVGRLVARKTIFFDEEADRDLSRWNTYAIDLKELIEPEPGAIYRVELSFNRDLSAYPCNELVRKSKEQLLADDEVKFKEEVSRFDGGGYYYYNGDFDWSDYEYSKRNDPCSNSYYHNTSVGRNVLASNLGLLAKAGEDGDMTVFVHNLLDTYPEKGVKVVAYNYQRRELASGVTDDKGQVRFALKEGKPFYLTASLGQQRSYLRVDDGSSLSLSMFDVSGEVVQKGIKGFIYGDRGVWRPGDTLHLGFMLNDRDRMLPANHPVIMELYNPIGQLYQRKTETQGESGLYVFDLPTEADAPTGAWNVNVNVGGITFTKRIRIETIKPNRLKISLTMPEKRLLRGEPLNASMHVEWLQGATARHLKYDIQGTFISTPTTFAGYSDFHFDDPSKLFNSEESKLFSGTTDAAGNAGIQARFEVGATAPGMLLANFVTRVYEESGDFSVDADRAFYSPYRRYAGIKPPRQDEEPLATGREHKYEVASVDYLGQAVAGTALEVKVYKVHWYWWWDSDKSRLANYVSNSYNKPVKTFTLRTGADGKASFHLKYADAEWGTYFITVKDKEGKHSTGVMSYFDWSYREGRRDMGGASFANKLTLKTDKENYSPGEPIVVTFPSVKGSRAIVSVENGMRLLSTTEHPCDAGQTTVKLDATSEMQPNAYLHITLLQPHGITKNDLPIRLYGIVPFTVTSPESHLHPVIRMADEIKPEAPYQVTVAEKNGREMAYTLAIVDEGLLDLTHFRTPDPWQAFHAREALGVHTWDLYDHVVGAYGGRIERLFSIGGDDALNKGPKAIVNRFKPVVQFAGPFRLKKGETKQHTYTMPNYNGRVRVMVVAGNGEAYGHTEKSVLVRKPVMLLGTLPRVIGTGEEMEVPATLFATEKGVGEVQVTIACSGNMEIVGEASRTLRFEAVGDKMASFRVRVKETPGAGHVTITAVGGGERSVYETDIDIRSVRRPQVKVTPVALEAGKSWKGKIPLPGVDGTNSLALEMSDVPPVNLTTRLSYLLGYPHGCVEQITSKAFPQLYLSGFATLTREQEQSVEATVKEVIRRLRSYQTADGSFSYWPGGTSSHAWGTVYATHFLLEAERKGYLVPEGMKRNLLRDLSRIARNWKPAPLHLAASEEMTQAYRLFVLALDQSAEVGAMNRLKESKSLAAMSRYLLAAAYALAGRPDVSKELVAKTTALSTPYSEYDRTFGSHLRDQSIRLMTHCLLEEPKEAALLANDLSQALASDDWLSTQSTAFALVALSDYRERYKVSGSMDFSYTMGGKREEVSTERNIWTKTLSGKAAASVPMELKNTGSSTLFARIVAEGTPAEGKEEAYANGLRLTVRYTEQGGRPLDISALPQGTNFTAEVTVANPSPRGYSHLVLTEIFPAGWEILNTRFLPGDTAVNRSAAVSHRDIRDDRVYSYIDHLPAGKQVTVRLHLCAVYPGRFYLPPVYCEAMYDRTVRANTEGRRVKVE